MTSRKKSFFEFWRSKEERRALLQRTDKLKLSPSQLSRLLGDSGVRAELQNARFAPLLPPVGTEVFRRFTPASLEEIKKERRKDKEVSEEDLLKPTSDLEAGKPLPFFYGDPPTELLNTPLEDLDPFYQSQKTFIVLSKGNIIHRFNADPSCYQLSPFSLLRTGAIKILIHSLFSLFIMLTVLINCAMMMMAVPPEWSEIAEYVFIAIYVFEAIIKIVARGFCVGHFTFLRDPWNSLDIVIIITACLTVFVDLGSISVLRFLKIMAITPGLRTTVGTLVQSVKRLANVIIVTVFFLSVFAAIGLQLFMGNLRQKCVINLFGNMGTNGSDFQEFTNNPEHQYFEPNHYDALLCGNSSFSRSCPEGFTCLKAGRNPNYGFTNYDSFSWAFLAMFRLMTQDYWEDLAHQIIAVGGKIYMIYLVVVLFLGSFYLLSLFMATIAMVTAEHSEASVAEAKRREEEITEILQALKKCEEDESEVSDKKDSPPQRKNSAAEIKNHKQEHTAIEGFKEEHTSCPPCCFSFIDHFLKWNCCGCWRWLKQRLYTFVMDPFFDLGIIICLIINIIFLSMEHYPMMLRFYQVLSIGHLVFTAIFTVEMILKIIALDPYGYFQVGWNIFDSIIVFVSLAELILVDVAGLYMLGSLILMRVIRLAKWWPSFNMLLRIMRNSVGALRNLTLVLVIMVVFFSVAGMQLFRRSYTDCVCRISTDCSLPRWHMADLFHAFLVVFRILCGEWIETMWDCMEVSGQTTCLIFFIMVLVIGKLLVLSLFMALLLANVAAPDKEEGGNKQRVIINRIRRALNCGQGTERTGPEKVKNEEDNKKEYLALTSVTSDQPVSECDVVPKVQKKKDDKNHDGNTPENCCCDKCYQCCSFLDIDTSRGKWRVWTNFRRCCLSIVEHSFFEALIIIIVVLSCIALVYNDIFLENLQVMKVVLNYAELVFACVFVVEMILMMVAFGFKRYFTNKWCWVEFAVVIVSLISVTSSMLGYASLTSIKCVRALRTVSFFPGTRVVVDVLLSIIPSLLDMLLVVLVAWLIFSILGVNLFAGKFYYCFNETSKEIIPPEWINNYTECYMLIEEGYTELRWKNQVFNYDNVNAGYLSLLQVTFKGAMDIMYAAVDSTEVESQPGYEKNPYMYLYFIGFIITSFFVFNFFIRGFINTINQLRHKFGGKHVFLTEGQKNLYRIKKKRFFNNKPQTPVPRPQQNKVQACVFDLVIKPCFEIFMFVIICISVVALMVETDDQNMVKTSILFWIHFILIIIFTIESILKIIAFGRRYFKDAWNILDFVLVIGSILGLFFSGFMKHYLGTPNLYSVIRLVRVLRILPLIPGTEGIRSLFGALVMALPALFNIGLLLFIIMFTFSVFGMSNFAYVKKAAMIDDLINFETVLSSMTCMFVITTGTGWGGLLYPIMVTPPDCDPGIENPGTSVRGNCGNPTLGVVFFSSYTAISLLLVISMYIAIILEIFDMNAEDSTEPLSEDDLQMFYNTWKTFDPDDSQCIQYSKLSEFCDTLKDPLRIPKPNTMKLIHMDLPLLPGDKIYYMDILPALTAQVFGDSGQVDALKANMEEKFKAKNTSQVSYEPISSTLHRKREEVAAAVIQRAYRKWRLATREGTEGQISQLNKETEIEPAR
ncbi:sodium channel protein type 4 subunit alpha B-like [Thunnus albacares]|uniref:sodium channel protein type 4 subunit alpha B-like n=1 Tax=Thunnus albacares TaxID=8236 RepID=UPI001CF69390|nr:sodium channel protein type 4 subunit alpha B-like [Thunnus albacares]